MIHLAGVPAEVGDNQLVAAADEAGGEHALRDHHLSNHADCEY